MNCTVLVEIDRTMFSRAIDEGLIVPERSVQIGIRTWVTHPQGITIIDNEAACETSPRSLATAIAAITSYYPKLYITVDTRSSRPRLTRQALGRPSPRGLTPLRLLQILRNLHMLPICGFDVVEVAPPATTPPASLLSTPQPSFTSNWLVSALGRGAVQKHYAALSGPALSSRFSGLILALLHWMVPLIFITLELNIGYHGISYGHLEDLVFATLCFNLVGGC